MKKILLMMVALLAMHAAFGSERYLFEGVLFVEDVATTYRFGNGTCVISDVSLCGVRTETAYRCQVMRQGAYLVADLYSDGDSNTLFLFSADSRHIIMYDCNARRTIACTVQRGHIDEPWIWPLAQYEVSSYLQGDEAAQYAPKNLSIRDLTKAWVGGADSGGGERVSFMNFGNGSRRIYIINGIFSPSRPGLFYDYARVKSLSIACYDENHVLVTTVEKSLADTGEMQCLEFDARYKYFDFIITDTYPGAISQHVALTGICADALDLYE